ncbi:cardiac phospholamban isoform X1 [Scyliorhinus torazame]
MHSDLLENKSNFCTFYDFHACLHISHNLCCISMDKVQQITRSAMRRASAIEVTPQARRNLQELFVNFTLILICLLLIYIIRLLM